VTAGYVRVRTASGSEALIRVDHVTTAVVDEDGVRVNTVDGRRLTAAHITLDEFIDMLREATETWTS
jgi:hypothetical protein